MTNDQIPRAWLITDERIGDRLWPTLERMPAGAGVVVRHDRAPDRATLAARIAEIAARRGLVLSIAGDVALAHSLNARFIHRPDDNDCELPFSLPVHSLEQAHHARDRGAAFVFVSPVCPTRSHPGAAALGKEAATALARASTLPAIALGGMNAAIFDRDFRNEFHGWAGIDAWLRT